MKLHLRATGCHLSYRIAQGYTCHPTQVFTCVGQQVTLCDPTWQVTLHSCDMVFHNSYTITFTFYLYPKNVEWRPYGGVCNVNCNLSNVLSNRQAELADDCSIDQYSVKANVKSTATANSITIDLRPLDLIGCHKRHPSAACITNLCLKNCQFTLKRPVRVTYIDVRDIKQQRSLFHHYTISNFTVAHSQKNPTDNV